MQKRPISDSSILLAGLTAACLMMPFVGASHSAPPTPSGKETPFLFGCDWPVDGSPTVKSLFYESGFNFARVTGGGYGWALDKHRAAVQELDTHGVKVLLQLGSHYPDAKYFDFKDSYLVDQKGETGKEDRNAWAITYNGSAWPQYSYASKTFRQELTKDFATYLAGMKDQKNITALLLHNEPGYHWLTDRVFDFNPQAIARFRVWLGQQHGNVENLNRRWGSKFASFDVVEPPHEMSPVTNMAGWLDWRRFHADLIQDFLQEEVVFAHRTRPGTPTTTNLAGPLDNWYPIRVGDNYRYTSGFEIAGIDIYPTEWSGPVFPGYTMDMTRGAGQGKKIYVAECEVFDPTRFKGLSEEQRADMLRSEVWTFIGHGADGVLLWSLSGQEGFRLTQGEFNARVAATREIAHLAPMLHLGSFAKPTPRVAVCVDQDSYVYYGGKEPGLNGGGHADQAARGLYAAVTAGRHEADVISAAQLREGIGKRYKALVLTLPVLMDDKLATQLRAFVSGGGLLITEAPFATHDRWGGELPQAPGFGLEEVFGIRQVRPENIVANTITTPSGTFASQNQTRFEATTARVVGTFGDKKPAVTVNRFGKGTAIYIGAEVGNPNESQWGRSGLRTFLASALKQYAQLAPMANVTYQSTADGFLDTSMRRDARGNQLIVLANPADRAKPLPTATKVTLSTTFGSLPPSTQAFIFPSEQHANGRVSAGPKLVSIQRNSKLPATITLPDISSALPVLLTQDLSPLLRLDAPEIAAAGDAVEIRVTCYNPSPKPLRVTPGLVIPNNWKMTSEPKPVVILARGEQTVVLRVKSGGGERSVIKARFRYSSDGKNTAYVNSVPVDILAKAP